MIFFLNLIDVSGIAAFVIWISKAPQWNEGKRHRRRLFLIQLGHELVELYLDRRRQQPQTTQRGVRLAVETIGLSIASTLPTNASAGVAKRRCQLCSRERDRKVITHCTTCNTSCCQDHHKTICNVCCGTFLQQNMRVKRFLRK